MVICISSLLARSTIPPSPAHSSQPVSESGIKDTVWSVYNALLYREDESQQLQDCTAGRLSERYWTQILNDLEFVIVTDHDSLCMCTCDNVALCDHRLWCDCVSYPIMNTEQYKHITAEGLMKNYLSPKKFVKEWGELM